MKFHRRVPVWNGHGGRASTISYPTRDQPTLGANIDYTKIDQEDF
jgi:hypothetical protein